MPQSPKTILQVSSPFWLIYARFNKFALNHLHLTFHLSSSCWSMNLEVLVLHLAIEPSILWNNFGNLAVSQIVLNQFGRWAFTLPTRFYFISKLLQDSNFTAMLSFHFPELFQLSFYSDIPRQGAPTWWWDIFFNTQETSAINPPSLLSVYILLRIIIS